LIFDYPGTGVNGAGVVGVATPPIFDLQGSSCVDDPQYFDKCFIFPFSGTSEYHKSLSVLSIKFIIQLQSMGHVNLKNNKHRMHHITPFGDEKFINFL